MMQTKGKTLAASLKTQTANDKNIFRLERNVANKKWRP